ncbi:DinB superfamily protein [Pseudobythopirellula maris]|uniref:DinB superfamily protein n=1 Tax=Pseudobythopirellula maris TaxID=2527991 RepID=A0A5C5ZUX3_9BACT|nr:DinB family protein [Pseudobythopirellula maris]TWT90043.1 DinB superfamily protein [Pseudobythopirellula maris]
MLAFYKQLTTAQFEAALATLGHCIDRCPEAAWDAPVAELKFCQVVHHTLFFTDLYLDQGDEAFRAQPFHAEHASYFRDYEELEPQRQTHLYDRSTTVAYLQHCREKAIAQIEAETEASLAAGAANPWIKFTRAELHLYNLRHVQHHAAQLSLRLRLDHGVDIPWVASGWHDCD